MPKFGSTGGVDPTRPVPRPENLGQATQGGGGLFGNFFPEQGSQAQYDMIMQMVQAGMSSAQGSNSPIANLLAPLAGAAISGRATRKHEDAKAELLKKNAASADEMANSLFGDTSNNPKMQGYIDVLNNPDAPEYMKVVARAGLKRATTPASGRGVSANPKKPPYARNTDALLAQLFQSASGENSDGGAEITAAERSRMELVKNMRSRTTNATSGGGSVVDELTGLMGGNTTGPSPAAPAVDENDPLGILLPPA